MPKKFFSCQNSSSTPENCLTYSKNTTALKFFSYQNSILLPRKIFPHFIKIIWHNRKKFSVLQKKFFNTPNIFSTKKFLVPQKKPTEVLQQPKYFWTPPWSSGTKKRYSTPPKFFTSQKTSPVTKKNFHQPKHPWAAQKYL